MKNTITRCLVGALIASFVGVVGAQELGPGARPIGADWSRSPVMAANGMAGMSFVLRSFDEVDEPMLKNFVDASKGVADVMNTLSDENIVGQANYKKLDKFVKAIDRLNPIRLKQVSDLTDALGIAVEGGNISAQQVDALKSSVVQQILRASIVDSSSQNNIQQNNSSRVSNFGGGSSASFVPVSVFVSK